MKKVKKIKKLSLKREKQIAWKAFSEYIRRSKANSQGYTRCYTCDKLSHWKTMDTGHWIEGHANAVFINPDYVRPQCKSCNIFNHGEQGIFRDRIRKELGNVKVDQLVIDSKRIVKYTPNDYQALTEHYKAQTKKLEYER